MRRIAVLGNGGGGKSTLSRALAARLELPLCEVDRVQWLPDWRAAPQDQTTATLDEWASRDAWIIDGFGPMPVIERRLDRADTIIHVDFPFWRHLWWSAKRQLVSRLRRRAWGGQERAPSTVRLFQTLRRVHRMRPQLLALTSAGDRATRLVHLRSPADMRRWLDSVGE